MSIWLSVALFKFLQSTEAAVGICYSKYVFLKSFLYSQKNICVGVSFHKVADLKLLKRDSNTGVFP